MSVYLALKEMWRSRGRFLLISLVIALITILVLFVAGLTEGLGSGNKEYLDKLNADLIVYKKNVDLSIASSRIDRSKLNDVRRVEGVAEAGQISFTNVSVVLPGGLKPLNVSLIGVEPGRPGEPPVTAGKGLEDVSGREAIIDRNVVLRTGLQVGSRFTIKSIQGSEEKFYSLRVAGVSDSRQYSLQPSIFVPLLTWEKVKPKAQFDDKQAELISNIVAVRLQDSQALAPMIGSLETQVKDIQVVDLKTAYEATPGYSAQQGTLNTQRGFALLIGVLVIGGFFQIQSLQKVPQIGMLKAIGASNSTIALTAVMQIVATTCLGIAIGTLGTLALYLSFPPTIPIIFTLDSLALAVASLLFIGPLGGLVSIQYALRVEPLTALGLTS